MWASAWSLGRAAAGGHSLRPDSVRSTQAVTRVPALITPHSVGTSSSLANRPVVSK
jgi:hypothetical protein